jgi:hypothetical protein
LVIAALYFLASFLGYRVIWATSELVEGSYQEIVDQVESGNTFIHPHINRYNESIAEYEQTKKTAPTFWMKYVVDFPEYEEVTYEQFKPRMDEIKKKE